MSTQLITRFAPSPTGDLHIGGVRTALYCWLLSKHFQGKCILRIEDTDRQRSTKESEQQILNSFCWLNMDFDQVYRQSERVDTYDNLIVQLLNTNKAYVCECSSERLDKLRTQQLTNKEKPRYDGKCRDKTLNWQIGRVVRLHAPQQGTSSFKDGVFGTIAIANCEMDDMIIKRSDGSLTYNFCCAVDDNAMGITLVIRGDDHINNTPRQIHVYHALGYQLPQFAHLPMILGKDGKRLSKRQGAKSVLDYRNAGLLPDAVMNYLARLGWSHGDTEIFSREELIDAFSLNKVSRSPATFDQDKLLWVNKQQLKQTPIPELIPPLGNFANLTQTSDADLQLLIESLRHRVDTLQQLAAELAPYCSDTITIDQQAAAKHLSSESLPVLKKLYSALTDANWQKDNLHQIVEQIAKSMSLKIAKVGMPLRLAITGRGFSPSLDITLRLIGKERVLTRLDKAIQTLQK